MVLSMNDDGQNVARRYLNLRETTYASLDKYRVEVEPGKMESWDEFFRRLAKSGFLEQLNEEK